MTTTEDIPGDTLLEVYQGWESDSSFEYDERSEPENMPDYICCKYKPDKSKPHLKTLHPFQVTKTEGAFIRGYYFEKSSMGDYVREDDQLWVKRKYFVCEISCQKESMRGSKSRGFKHHYVFSGMP